MKYFLFIKAVVSGYFAFLLMVCFLFVEANGHFTLKMECDVCELDGFFSLIYLQTLR
jgi:hypothetical protein